MAGFGSNSGLKKYWRESWAVAHRILTGLLDGAAA